MNFRRPAHLNKGYIGLIALMIGVLAIFILVAMQVRSYGTLKTTTATSTLGRSRDQVTPIQKAQDAKDLVEGLNQDLLETY